MSEPLLLEHRDTVAIISINDAPFNRMSLGFIDALGELVAELATDSSVRALVITRASVAGSG